MIFKVLCALLLVFSFQVSCCENRPPSSKSARIGVYAIDWYKQNIASLNILQCDFYPTCSQYTKQAMQKYGFLKGWMMGCDRLMRCNHDLWVYPEVKVDGQLKKYDPIDIL